MASIRERNNKGGWQAQVRKRGWPPVTRTFKTKADAQQWAAEQEAAMRRGAFVDVSSLKGSTLGQLLERYRIEVTPTKKGAEVESYRLGAMAQLPMAALTMDRLNSAVVIEWRNGRAREVSGDTVSREMNLLSSVINFARSEWGLPMQNPVTGIRRPKQARGRNRRPTWSEVKCLLRALSPRDSGQGQGYWVGTRNPWIRPAMVLALRTAMRRGEILSMRWEHVESERRCIHLPDTKLGEARDVPLSRKAMRVLQRLPNQGTSGRVFPVSAEAFKKAFSRAVERTGISNLRFHDFRHDATTRLAERLTNVLELSAVTGHRSLTTLRRYYNPSPAELARKLD